MKILALILFSAFILFGQEETETFGNDTVLYTHLKFLDDQGDAKFKEFIIEEYRRFLSIYPGSSWRADVLFNIATRYHTDEEYDIALVYYLKVVMLFPEFKTGQVKNQIEQIIFNYEVDRYSNVADFINKEVATDRSGNQEIDNLFQFIKVLSSFADDKQLALLRESIEEFIRKYPNSINLDTIFILLAKSYERSDDYVHGMIHYLSFIKLFLQSEQRPFVLMQMAQVYQDEFKEYYNAKKYYKEFVTSFPNNVNAHDAQFKAAILLDDELEDYAEALVEYEYYMTHYADKPHAVEVLKRIAVIYYNQENYQKAIESYERVVANYRTDPRASEFQDEIISIYDDRLNNLSKAIDEMVRFAEFFPEHEDAHEHMYEAVEQLLELKNRQKAEDVAAQLKASFPNSDSAVRVDQLFNSP